MSSRRDTDSKSAPLKSQCDWSLHRGEYFCPTMQWAAACHTLLSVENHLLQADRLQLLIHPLIPPTSHPASLSHWALTGSSTVIHLILNIYFYIVRRISVTALLTDTIALLTSSLFIWPASYFSLPCEDENTINILKHYYYYIQVELPSRGPYSSSSHFSLTSHSG